MPPRKAHAVKSREHRVVTTHARILPRPDDLIEFNSARQEGAHTDEAAHQARLTAAVHDVARRQPTDR
jgi:hypothetical protein